MQFDICIELQKHWLQERRFDPKEQTCCLIRDSNPFGVYCTRANILALIIPIASEQNTKPQTDLANRAATKESPRNARSIDKLTLCSSDRPALVSPLALSNIYLD